MLHQVLLCGKMKVAFLATVSAWNWNIGEIIDTDIKKTTEFVQSELDTAVKTVNKVGTAFKDDAEGWLPSLSPEIAKFLGMPTDRQPQADFYRSFSEIVAAHGAIF